MIDLISRRAALDIIDSELNGWMTDDERLHLEGVAIGIECLPRIDTMPVVRCKDCKHRPIDKGWHNCGEDLFFPDDGACPCQCDDHWFSRMPDDNWFCANGKRSEKRRSN